MTSVSTATEVDWSQPVAALLRIGTAQAHEKAEHSEGAAWLTRGELDREEYVRFLMMLYHVYETFERALDRHATHPVLAPTYNPTLFSRTPSLSADIAYLLETPESSWQSHPIHETLVSSPPEPFADYTARLQELADDESQVPRLLAHAYVRYLGDLSGGQFIKRRLVKAYGLEDGAGVSFYEFKQLGGSGSSTMGDMKKIKEWYRAGMNAGVGDDVALKVAILDEANVAFELNSGLFTTLKPPSEPPMPSSPMPDIMLGEPLTPTTDSPTPKELTPEPAVTKVVYEAPSQEGTFPVASVIAFILALCLSHFVLVLGGFTGDKGYGKLEAVIHWFTDLFSPSA
ncbi:hypothetical protein EW026_g1777 [Hermanssonia centrifuga]|uniref:Heme oxygenase n=1 Tax=Hermanssonia centrifuga TaxID=98765 RepID=A0A4S4KQD8_9APHY|nr:hypothetical protein EW026_g1777 [Hermanssonia centrifuga]